MQRITFVNAYGEQLVFGCEPPILLRTVSGLSRPDPSVIKAQAAYQNGEQFVRLQLPGRFVQIGFDLLPMQSREAMYQQRMHIERVLASGRCVRNGAIGTLIYENDAGAFMTAAVPDGACTYGKRFLNGMAGNSLTLYCPDAFLQDRNEQIAQMRMGTSGATFPTKLPIQLGARKFQNTLFNAGTAPAPVTLTLYGTGETPTVINHTTGAKIVVSRQVASGERLEIHTDPRALSCRIIHENGESEDAFGYLDASIALSVFLLDPGANDVEYVPSVVSNESRLEISWRSYYEGV